MLQESTGISSLPCDVMWDIFGRLPTKSIGRSRCVVKRWLLLTTDPQFVSNYSVNVSGFFLYRQPGRPEMFHIDRSTISPHPTLPSIFARQNDRYLCIIHSCNGLLLFRLRLERDRLCVCNPTTHEHVEVPYPRGLKSAWRYRLNFSLAFHPSTCPRFKIFAGQYLIRNRSYVIHRFSSETWSWHKILTLDYFPYQAPVCTLLNAYWNGYLCWIMDGWLQCLDVNTETMTRLSLPLPLISSVATVYAGTPDGHRLHCFVTNRCSKGFYVNDIHIYEMESASTGWSLLYRADLTSIVNAFRDGTSDFAIDMRILWFIRGQEGREEEDVLILRMPHTIGVYNLKVKTFSELSCANLNGSQPNHPSYGLNLLPHADSLLPL